MSTVTRSNPFATVIDTRPGEVRVRLADNTELPRWYPSLLEETVIGAEGTMLRGNQERMLFIPHGFDEIDAYTKAEVDALITASGSFPGFGGSGVVDLAARSDHTHAALHTHANSAVLDATTASFTTADETKLDGIATGAEVNVQSDWTAASGDALILNKPTLGTAAAMASTAFATAAQGALADSAVQPATLTAHTGSTSNPHSVTKAQVGLGNADNTSDLAKPISTATQTALDGKATAAQGALADTAVQPAAIVDFETTTQLNARDTANRSRANHTGNQAISTVTNLQEILDGKPVVVDVGNRATALGVDATASGASSFAGGDTASATNTDALALGTDATASGVSSVAMGVRASATALNALAVGTDSTAAEWSTAVGVEAEASGTVATALGGGSRVSGDFSTALGASASSDGDLGTALGYTSEADGNLSTALGYNATVPITHDRSSAIGADAVTTGPDQTVIAAASLYVKPHASSGTNTSTLSLQSPDGTAGVIAVANDDTLSVNGVGMYTQAQVDALIAASRPRIGSASGSTVATVSSASDTLFTNATVTLSGLTNGQAYRVVFTVNERLTGAASTSGQYGAAIVHSGGTQTLVCQSTAIPAGTSIYTFTYSGSYLPSSGTITVTPVFRWALGTVSTVWAACTAHAEIAG